MAQQSAPLPPQPPVTPKNGFGTTALVLGIIALLFAWIPFVGFIGFVLGVLAIVFGGIAVNRAHKRLASNKVMSYFGLALGVLAFVISIATFGSVVNSISSTTPPPANAPAGEATEHAFAGTATWSGGEQITVAVPNSAAADNPYLGPADGKRWIAVDVTVTNTGTRPYDVMSTAFTAQHSSRVAQEAYMSDANDSLPSTELAPGSSVSFTKVFEVEDSAGEFKLSVKPNAFASTTAYFTGTV